jgi:hypothetical protein
MALKIPQLKRAANGKSFFDYLTFLYVSERKARIFSFWKDINARPVALSLFCCQMVKLKMVKMSNFKSPGTFKNKKRQKG